MTPHAKRALADRGPAPEGYHYAARVDTDWRLATGERTKCRRGSRPACPAPVVAEFARSYSRWVAHTRRIHNYSAWWAYCEDHMYGRWIEDGQVWGWILVEDTVDGEP